jgi:ribosomal subunit interface protein
MQLIIESPGMQPGHPLEKLVQQKFSQLAKKYDSILKTTVVLTRVSLGNKDKYRLDAQLSLSGKMLFATATEDSFAAALSGVIDRLAHQLRRYKERREEIW